MAADVSVAVRLLLSFACSADTAALLLDLLFMADHYDYLLKVVLIGDSKVMQLSTGSHM